DHRRQCDSTRGIGLLRRVAPLLIRGPTAASPRTRHAEAGSVATRHMRERDGFVVPGDRLFFFQAEDGIRDWSVTGVQTCALPISGVPTATVTTLVGWPVGRALLTITGSVALAAGNKSLLATRAPVPPSARHN